MSAFDRSSILAEVGSRVRDGDGYRGTVRYIGPVAVAKDASETWLGVEWDTAGRGKHDGSCVDSAGILYRYFTCIDGWGSFVKPAKVTCGKSFIEVLKERYVTEDAPITAPGNIVPDAFVLTSSGQQKSIEFLGEQKIRRWQQVQLLQKVAIRTDCVSYCEEDVQEFAGHLTDIDLQDNLIWKWCEVANFCKFLPLLHSIQLHGNKMQPVTQQIVSTLETNAFASLRVLALNGCEIKSWDGFILLEPLLRGIEELYLSGNVMNDFPAANAVVDEVTGAVRRRPNFPNLRILDLSGCGITDWQCVLTFGELPLLQDLRVDDNPISLVSACPVNNFPQLARISMSSTRISSWSCIDALDSFPHCHNLRLSHVPLFSGKGASEVRPVVIGRISRLRFFNGSSVSDKERYDSERSYLRRIFRELGNATSSSTSKPTPELVNATVSVLHPRFLELRGKYESEMLPVGGGAGTSTAEAGTIAAELISVTFKNMTVTAGGSNEPITKKLPLSLAISKLRGLVKQMFGVEQHLQQLSIRQYKDSPPTLLDDDDANLGYFGFCDGSELFVNGIDG
jgi:tubulin-specific chaperone E